MPSIASVWLLRVATCTVLGMLAAEIAPLASEQSSETILAPQAHENSNSPHHGLHVTSLCFQPVSIRSDIAAAGIPAI